MFFLQILIHKLNLQFLFLLYFYNLLEMFTVYSYTLEYYFTTKKFKNIVNTICFNLIHPFDLAPLSFLLTVF